MLDRQAAIAWYCRNRERTRALFDLLARDGSPGEDVYYRRPIALRHPIVFYEGHLPAFSFNTVVKKALGGPSIDARLEDLFARGIDPSESQSPQRPPSTQSASVIRAQHSSANSAIPAGDRDGWPSRTEVLAFAAEADARMLEALRCADLDRPGHPLLDRAEAVFTILEHEAMHHETLLYMWHRLPLEDKRRPAGYSPRTEGPVPPQEWLEIPGGTATLGVDREHAAFGWDNEFPRCRADVETFRLERFNVTNARFLEFMDAGGYHDPRWWRPEDWRWIESEHITHPIFWEDPGATNRDGTISANTDWYWRGMFDRIPLPLAWPVYVSHAEAEAYARWRGVRLPTEAEYQRAAFGSPRGESLHPWGDATPTDAHGVFDLSSWDPEPAGSHPAGRSAWGVDDLAGNGWEWTSTTFGPFPGFRPMASYPEYSADFFDGEHMVMKGASPATAVELLRPTFRNWFRRRYPYVYATFRCAADLVSR
jgi:gamma-glutamyl hercynylcysteine S-oxide synthase